MKNTIIAATAIVFVAALGFAALSSSRSGAEATTGESSPAPAAVVKRGEYLVSIMGCNDCHTPWKMGPQGPEPDMERFLSGHPEEIGPLAAQTLPGPYLWAGIGTNTAYTGPWGVSYAFNLTPEQNTGIGIWTEDMFVKAIRLGRHMGTSRPINPPMPWPAYRNATDDDLKAIYAYLRTIKPIVNRVPEYIEPVHSN